MKAPGVGHLVEMVTRFMICVIHISGVDHFEKIVCRCGICRDDTSGVGCLEETVLDLWELHIWCWTFGRDCMTAGVG